MYRSNEINLALACHYFYTELVLILTTPMKRIYILLLPIILFSCSGSDTYQGKWYALNSDNSKFELSFSAKSFTIKDSTGTAKDYEYSQRSYNYSNSVVTYGIQLSDGRTYQITFPKSDDPDVALLADGNGTLMFTLGRKKYVTYNDIYDLAI